MFFDFHPAKLKRAADVQVTAVEIPNLRPELSHRHSRKLADPGGSKGKFVIDFRAAYLKKAT
ncbi:MAG: hypothetical protein JO323_03000 [Acidobacteriia bacterium]|nr:hypothetical protein [Terriglobia bacterium]